MTIQIFDAIAPDYDKVNRVLSLGMDRRWRQKAVHFLPEGSALHVLDLAAGTAEMAIILGREARVGRVTGIDCAEEMLRLGRLKVQQQGLVGKVQLIAGDALALAFKDHEFDVVTAAFGVRNFPDLMQGLAEAFRVLKPGGRCIILEFSMPSGWWQKIGHSLYLGMVVPLIGGLFTGKKGAYCYLGRSIRAFPSGERMVRIIRQAGFGVIERYALAMGAVTIYVATR